jgi:hypothetical protein
MDPVTAATVASAAISVGKGVHQAYKAHKLSQKKRPTYKRPKEIDEAANIYRQKAAGLGLPGEELMREQIQAQQSNIIEKGRAAGDSNAYLQSLTAAGKSGIDAERAMRLEALQRKDAAMGELAGFKANTEAAYTDKEWDYNKNQPYQGAMAAASALKEASFKNIESGLNKGIGAATGGAGGAGGTSSIAGTEGAAGAAPQRTGAVPTSKPGVSAPTAKQISTNSLDKFPQQKVMKLRQEGFDDAQIEGILMGKIGG